MRASSPRWTASNSSPSPIATPRGSRRPPGDAFRDLSGRRHAPPAVAARHGVGRRADAAARRGRAPVRAAGVHVLVEKPIAATSMRPPESPPPPTRLAWCSSVGHIERFNPAVAELKRRLEEGQGGRVLQVSARRVGPLPPPHPRCRRHPRPRPHDIDIMRFLLDDEVERVYAESAATSTPTTRTCSPACSAFAGRLGLLDINWLTPTKERTLTVLCEKGHVRCRLRRPIARPSTRTTPRQPARTRSPASPRAR